MVGNVFCGQAVLQWDPPIVSHYQSMVAGYKIYIGTSSRTYNLGSIDVGNVLTHTITNLEENTTIYYFAATWYDANGNEDLSGFSNEVSWSYGIPHLVTEVQKTGSGEGTVTSYSGNQFEIDCGYWCYRYSSIGSTVSLTATPSSGSIFVGWSGEGCSGTGNCIFTATSNTTIEAIFESFQASPVYRFWSDQNQGHFYTASELEKNYVIANYPSNIWRYEIIAFYVYLNQIAGTKPTYRFWSDKNKKHFYTASESEKNYVIANYPSNIWRYEGIAWYVPEN